MTHPRRLLYSAALLAAMLGSIVFGFVFGESPEDRKRREDQERRDREHWQRWGAW